MDFDDLSKIQLIDQERMIEKIRGLANQIQLSWLFVQRQENLIFPLINHICIAGVYTNSNIIEILWVMANENCSIGISGLDGCKLPVWCRGKDNLLLLVADNDNADEMMDLINLGVERECSIFVLLANQKIKSNFITKSVACWVLDDHDFDRSTIGFDTFILYGILYKLGLVPDISQDISNLKLSLETTIQHIDLNIPSALNPAKRLAGQMIGRWIKIVAGGVMFPVANRWSNQINQSAKALSNAENIYQLASYSLSGIYNPEILVQHSLVIFLKSHLNNQKIEWMIDKAKEELMCNGLGTDSYSARGDDPLNQIWNTILFGDFLAYYLAIAYECDPTPTASLS